jgi:DNA-binding NarL/FixJ family response regulator
LELTVPAFKNDTPLDLTKLSYRQAQIVGKMKLDGIYSNKRIAKELEISPETISTHFKVIFRKLDLQGGKLELLARVTREQIVQRLVSIF